MITLSVCRWETVEELEAHYEDILMNARAFRDEHLANGITVSGNSCNKTTFNDVNLEDEFESMIEITESCNIDLTKEK